MDMISILKSVGYAGIWTALFCEGAFAFGIFLPGDSLLFPVGILIGQGVFNLWVMLTGCFISAFLGNLVGYEIGKRWGPALIKTKYGQKFIKPEHLDKCNYFFGKYGAFTVVIARFIHFARTIVPFVAGMSHMHYGLFVAYSALGALLWAVGVPLIGYMVVRALPEDAMNGSVDTYILPIIAMIIFIVAFPAIKKYVKKRFFNKPDTN